MYRYQFAIVTSEPTKEQLDRLSEIFGGRMDLFYALIHHGIIAGGAALYVRTGIGPVGDIDFFIGNNEGMGACARLVCAAYPDAKIERSKSVLTITCSAPHPFQFVRSGNDPIRTTIQKFDFDYCQCGIEFTTQIYMLATCAAIRSHETRICAYYQFQKYEPCPNRIIDRVRKLQRKGFRLPPDIFEARDLSCFACRGCREDITYEHRQTQPEGSIPVRKSITLENIDEVFLPLVHFASYTDAHEPPIVDKTMGFCSLYDMYRFTGQPHHDRSDRLEEYHMQRIPIITSIHDYNALNQFHPSEYYSTYWEALAIRYHLADKRRRDLAFIRRMGRMACGIQCIALARAFACPTSPAHEWATQAGHTLRKIYKYVLGNDEKRFDKNCARIGRRIR